MGSGCAGGLYGGSSWIAGQGGVRCPHRLGSAGLRPAILRMRAGRPRSQGGVRSNQPGEDIRLHLGHSIPFTATKLAHTGAPTSMLCPVAVRRPDFESMPNTTTVPES